MYQFESDYIYVDFYKIHNGKKSKFKANATTEGQER